MSLTSKNIPLLILGITALLCSRTMLVSFDDPEGPNLLIVVMMAAVIYVTALALYIYSPKIRGVLRRDSAHIPPATITNIKRILLVMVIQILIATTFYFCLR